MYDLGHPSMYITAYRILSVRELRTLMARVTDLPLDAKKTDAFESILRNCQGTYNGSVPTVDPVEFETHYDPDLVSHGFRLDHGSRLFSAVGK